MNWLADADGGWFSTWFGVDDASSGGAFTGFGPAGAATFALDLQEGYTVTYRWPTDIRKSYSGKEQRVSRNDVAKESYEGTAMLLGDAAVAVRNTMARYAALGSMFLLALPHEQLTLEADATGTTLYVSDTSLSDCLNPGQRVVCVREDDDGAKSTVEGIVQSSAPNSITLDVDPGTAGLVGGFVMPLRQIYLDPEQAFPRYANNVEQWELRGRAAVLDFARLTASLALGPLTTSTGLDSAIVTAKTNDYPILFGLVDGGSIATGRLIEGSYTVGIGYASVTFVYQEGVTTIGDLITVLATSTLIVLSGATNPTQTLIAGELVDGGDMFGAFLAGASTAGPVGTGATLSMHSGRPVWDRLLENDSTITDSLQAMTEIIDHDGVPYAIGSAAQADWGRTVVVSGELGADFQWLKLFLATVRGPALAFWLSTWRGDLEIVSWSGPQITVAGDVSAWYPSQRQHLHIQDSGIDIYSQIGAAVDNGDGTWTLSMDDVAAFVAPERVSWLELTRFTQPEFRVEFKDGRFELQTIATVVQQ